MKKMDKKLQEAIKTVKEMLKDCSGDMLYTDVDAISALITFAETKSMSVMGEVQTKLITCPECDHTWTVGFFPSQIPKQGECPLCNGSGEMWADSGYPNRPCMKCNGSGKAGKESGVE